MGEYALRLANSVDTAPRVRMGDALAMQHGGGPLATRSGLRPDGGGEVTAVAGTMSVQVSPFFAWVDGAASDLQGGYPFVLDAAKVLPIADGAASLPRVDVIAAVVREDAFDGTGATSASVEVVTGTPGAGAPALPASAIALRNIDVPAGLSAGTGGLSSANIGTDRRQWLTAGVLPVGGATERDALSPQAGQVVYRKDTNTLEAFDGSAWGTYSPDTAELIEKVPTADIAVTTAASVDIPGLSVTVDSPGPDAKWVVSMTLDQQKNSAASSRTLIVDLVAGGVALPSQFVTNSAGRMSITRSWVVTGLAAGSQIIKVRAGLNGDDASGFQIRSTHSNMIVDRRI